MCRFKQNARLAPGIIKKGCSMEYQGIGGLIVLAADVWAIVNIFQSGADTGGKVLWTVLVIVLPVLGFILWYFLGPKTGKI
jgi:Phospholipase_D-nuclease N-terminal